MWAKGGANCYGALGIGRYLGVPPMLGKIGVLIATGPLALEGCLSRGALAGVP